MLVARPLLLLSLLPLSCAVRPSCDGCSASRRAVLNAAAATSLLRVPQAASARTPKPIVATDRNGAAVTAAGWLANAGAEPDLVLGLDGEPFFLLTSNDGDRVLDYALKAECTHLGCLVQPDPLGAGFACPCHGSKYAADGAVTRGPAPKALGLAKVATDEQGNVVLSPWEDADFRQAA